MICMQVGALKIDLGGTEHGILLDSDFGGVDWWSELSGGGGHPSSLRSDLVGEGRKRQAFFVPEMVEIACGARKDCTQYGVFIASRWG